MTSLHFMRGSWSGNANTHLNKPFYEFQMLISRGHLAYARGRTCCLRENLPINLCKWKDSEDKPVSNELFQKYTKKALHGRGCFSSGWNSSQLLMTSWAREMGFDAIQSVIPQFMSSASSSLISFCPLSAIHFQLSSNAVPPLPWPCGKPDDWK